MESGLLFRVWAGKRGNKTKRATIADLDVEFHKLLRRVQKKCPSLIPDSVDIGEEYSVYRALRRGATSQAQNVVIPKEVIEANNRW
jgi:hypothetical protein